MDRGNPTRSTTDGTKRRNPQEQHTDVTLHDLRKSLLYSESIGIDLAKHSDEEVFKWFLASVLYGARISATIAEKTYRSFEKHHLLTPQSILMAGWDYLVNPVMREGGYVRYDEKTSREILSNCDMLITDYGGSLNELHSISLGPSDLENRLLRFFGVGPVTVNIFLRELRPFWQKANPDPLPVILQVAQIYSIDLDAFKRKSLVFARIEAGLLRLRKRAKNEPKLSRY